MGALDGAFGELVPALLGAFSDTAAVFTRSSSEFDPATDTNTVTTLTAEVLTSPPEGFALQLINGSSIQSGDRRITTGAAFGDLGQPRIGDEVVRGEMTGTVVAVSPLNSGDAVVAYELQIRTP
jgi:hypothetical protein